MFLELKRLATVSHPLLTVSNDAGPMDSGQLLTTSFQLTNAGKAVLDGDEDFVKLNGIDRWLGGVHLEGDDAVWRWDEVTEALVCKHDT